MEITPSFAEYTKQQAYYQKKNPWGDTDCNSQAGLRQANDKPSKFSVPNRDNLVHAFKQPSAW